MTDLSASDAAKLQMNARGLQVRRNVGPRGRLVPHDLEAWRRLPPVLQDHASLYADFREHHRRAVRAGVIKEGNQ